MRPRTPACIRAANRAQQHAALIGLPSQPSAQKRRDKRISGAVAVDDGPLQIDAAEMPDPVVAAHWTEAASPTLERQELYPEILDGKIYVVGGLRNQNTDYSSYFEAYDPSRKAWTRLAPLPEARHHITLSALKGRLYGVGGFTGPFPHWQAQSTVFVYDPAAQSLSAWRGFVRSARRGCGRRG